MGWNQKEIECLQSSIKLSCSLVSTADDAFERLLPDLRAEGLLRGAQSLRGICRV